MRGLAGLGGAGDFLAIGAADNGDHWIGAAQSIEEGQRYRAVGRVTDARCGRPRCYRDTEATHRPTEASHLDAPFSAPAESTLDLPMATCVVLDGAEHSGVISPRS